MNKVKTRVGVQMFCNNCSAEVDMCKECNGFFDYLSFKGAKEEIICVDKTDHYCTNCKQIKK